MRDPVIRETSVRLCQAGLSDLPGDISIPRYDRSALTPGIVHIGMGNFHRAHQAWYLHRLMQEGKAHDWAIIGAGVRAGDSAMREKLIAQDCLTTLISLDPDRTELEVIGSVIDFLPVEKANGPLVSAMSDPRIRIVSMTITEGGYYIDPATGAFDPAHPDIVHDRTYPDQPVTVFGAMILALRARRDAGHPPFTAQCCDNLQGNGEVLKSTVTSLARLTDPDLAAWIEAHVSFPNSMVDCIVPATGSDVIALAKERGIDDQAPVSHEPFRQWVIEDRFVAGRPEWEFAGATLTDDVHDHEAMKIRILNAGHQVIANIGELLGLETIADCMEHSEISAFFGKVQREEIIPYVDPVPGITPEAYVRLIECRFSNPSIRDTVRRVAFDGSSRHTGFVLPVLREALVAGGPVSGLALVEALWARMCTGTREDGSRIAPNDPHWGALSEAAKAARASPDKWLEQRQFYGTLADEPEFRDAFCKWLHFIQAEGSEEAVSAYLKS